LALLGFALMSPVDVLGSQLFTLHMVQHVLVMMFVPPLLWLSNPLPFVLWGLPGPLRPMAGAQLAPGKPVRNVLRAVSSPGLLWLVSIIILWGWHDPNLYNLALENSWVHDLQHLTFFGVSMLYWWNVIGAGPRVRKSLPAAARIAFALAAVPATMLAGIVIAFSPEPIYTYYEAMPRLWGLSVLDDQRLAGVIMWIPGSMMYLLTALILVARWMGKEAAKPALRESQWAESGALLAPGVGEQQ
jgi:cytochrome c oxidase assembly factor CtaG